MERPVQFRNNIISVFVLLLLSQCSLHTEQEKISDADKELSSVNGIIYYRKAPFTGMIYTLYPNSNDTAIIMNYRKGKEDGEWKKFYEKGVLKERREFDNGEKTGKYLAYWDNGKKQLEYNFKDGEYEGICREWNKDGIVVKEMNYKKGYEQGSQKVFYDNGKIRSNYIMIDGRRYGLLGTKNCINVSDSVFKK